MGGGVRGEKKEEEMKKKERKPRKRNRPSRELLGKCRSVCGWPPKMVAAVAGSHVAVAIAWSAGRQVWLMKWWRPALGLAEMM